MLRKNVALFVSMLSLVAWTAACELYPELTLKAASEGGGGSSTSSSGTGGAGGELCFQCGGNGGGGMGATGGGAPVKCGDGVLDAGDGEL